jgi:hypothetical protein
VAVVGGGIIVGGRRRAGPRRRARIIERRSAFALARAAPSGGRGPVGAEALPVDWGFRRR